MWSWFPSGAVGGLGPRNCAFWFTAKVSSKSAPRHGRTLLDSPHIDDLLCDRIGRQP